jgi:hypothetical protein
LIFAIRKPLKCNANQLKRLHQSARCNRSRFLDVAVEMLEQVHFEAVSFMNFGYFCGNFNELFNDD